MEARDIDGKELLQRLQMCEEKLSEFTESKLSPFNQQEFNTRLQQMEEQMGAQKVEAEAALAAKGSAEAELAAAAASADPPSISAERSKPRLGEVGWTKHVPVHVPHHFCTWYRT